jgi:hypothetical protein
MGGNNRSLKKTHDANPPGRQAMIRKVYHKTGSCFSILQSRHAVRFLRENDEYFEAVCGKTKE